MDSRRRLSYERRVIFLKTSSYGLYVQLGSEKYHVRRKKPQHTGMLLNVDVNSVYVHIAAHLFDIPAFSVLTLASERKCVRSSAHPSQKSWPDRLCIVLLIISLIVWNPSHPRSSGDCRPFSMVGALEYDSVLRGSIQNAA